MSDPVECCVLLCPSSEQSRSLRSVCFFDFPHPNDPRYPVWIERTLRPKDWTPSPSSKICSRHFRPADILTLPLADGSGRTEKRLKYDALPSVFEGIPDSMRPRTVVVPRADSPEIILPSQYSKKRSVDSLDEIGSDTPKDPTEHANASVEDAEAPSDAQSNVSHANLKTLPNNFQTANAADPVSSSSTIPSAKKARHLPPPVISISKPIAIRPACLLAPKIVDGRLREGDFCCVPGCETTSKKGDSVGGTFFEFLSPGDKRYGAWLRMVRYNASWIPEDHTRICTEHFPASAIKHFITKSRLHSTAFPTQLSCMESLCTFTPADMMAGKEGCAVCGLRPLAANRSLKASEKLEFYRAPSGEIREKWIDFCKTQRNDIDWTSISEETPWFLCENHFDAQNKAEYAAQTAIPSLPFFMYASPRYFKSTAAPTREQSGKQIHKKTRTAPLQQLVCCVPGCHDYEWNEAPPEQVAHYRFYGNGMKRNEWVNHIRCAISWKPKSLDTVCSRHFCPDDFLKITADQPEKSKRLRSNVIPSQLDCVEKYRAPRNTNALMERDGIQTCCVCGCWRPSDETDLIPSERLSFFPFPDDDILRDSWVIACRQWNPSLIVSSESVICENHFVGEDLTFLREDGKESRVVLKRRAIPRFAELPVPVKLKKADSGVKSTVGVPGAQDGAVDVTGVPDGGFGGFSLFEPFVDTADDYESEVGVDIGIYEERDVVSPDDSTCDFDATEDDDSRMEVDKTDAPVLEVTNSIHVALRMPRVAENGLPGDEDRPNVGAVHDISSALPFTTEDPMEDTFTPPRCGPDDALIYCDCCHKLLPTPCWLHAVSVCDELVVPFSVGSLPKMLYLDVCDDSITGKAVFTKEVIGPNTLFGPLIAPLTPGDSEKARYFCVTDEHRKYYEMESDYACNWMKHVRFADSLQNSNLLVFSRGSEVVFVTIKTVAPREELKVWYSKQYLEMVEPHGKADVEDVKLEMDEVGGISSPCDDYTEREPALGSAQATLSGSSVEAICMSHLPIESGTLSPAAVSVDGDYRQTDECRSNTPRTRKTRNVSTSHICSECKVRFRSENMLRLHQFSHTGYDDLSEQECPECSKHFDDFPALLKHVDEHGTALVQCPVCNETCSLTSVLNHLHRYHRGVSIKKIDLRPVNCDKCGLRFTNNFLCRLHQRGHQDQECIDSIIITRRCPECGEMFESLDKLAEHVSTHGSRTQKCPVCNGCYSWLKEHIAHHHPQYLGEMGYPECGKKSSQKSHLRGHQPMASSDSSTCEECGLQFPKDSLYVLHKSSHEAASCHALAGAQRCPECDKECDGMDRLHEHIVTHAVAAEKCPQCIHWFPRHRLRTHIKRQHSARAPDPVLQEEESNDDTVADGAFRVRFRNTTCAQCGLRFSTDFLYRIHEYEHGSKELAEDLRSTTACAECAEEFEDFDALVKHVRIHGRQTEECPVCKRRYHRLIGHIWRHQRVDPGKKCGDNPYRCGECGKEFASAASLASHVNSHLFKAALIARTCDECGLRFKTDIVCRLHKLQHGNAESTEPMGGTRECPECHLNLENVEDWTAHINQHGKATKKCPKCGDWYAALAAHIRHDHQDDRHQMLGITEHNNDNGGPDENYVNGAYRCPKCSKVFPSKRTLAGHIPYHRAHEGRYSSLTCSECGLRFNSELLCRLHEGITGMPKCQRSFVTPENVRGDGIFEELDELVAHVAGHGKPTEKCPVCGGWFGALKYHTRQVHPDYYYKVLGQEEADNGNDRPDAGDVLNEPYKCPKCGKEFTSRSDSMMHIARHRASERLYENLTCSDCGLRFDSEALCNLHRMQHTEELSDHRIDVNDCPHCGESFQQVTKLLEHVASHGKRTDKCPVCGRWYAALKDHIRRDHQERFAEFVAQTKAQRYSDALYLYNSVTCSECGLRFGNVLLCRLHTLQHSSDGYSDGELNNIKSCPECEEEFPELELLVSHVSAHGKATSKCSVCSRWFSCLRVHMSHEHPEYFLEKDVAQLNCSSTKVVSDESNRKEHSKKSYRCPKCGRGFEKCGAFKQHVQVHCTKASSGSATCDMCGLRFMNEQLCELHEISHGLFSKNLQSTGKCPECGETFQQLQALAEHVGTHGVQTEKCPICNKWFASLRRHARQCFHHADHNDRPESSDHASASQKKTAVCVQCGKDFRSRAGLQAHMKTDHAALKCVICDEVFGNDGDLLQHLLDHSPKKELKCEICQKTFQSPRIFASHVREHESGKLSQSVAEEPAPNECLLCWKSFADSLELNQHVKKHNVNGGFECAMCDAKFPFYRLLSRHVMEEQHLRPKTGIPCSVCHEKLPDENALQLHLITHRDAELVVKCGQCTERFPCNDDLDVHIAATHASAVVEGSVMEVDEEMGRKCWREMMGELTDGSAD
ncbi:LOW QUALITY PROTEIN: uncharacterized protein LOC129585518 [Paramacrobiotus metropolitanus]|uniref:LOW QUALITY PROTEIN: uncharacterized protein LOC129585518 n=1 Tax=Paramacrobiotus metropolitanus TaxID=2943436 RepID=UPI002445F382|nr:LOW QUALITY PROTEIN: uncharacterized protein LOC129585518 [Paramacrobiotus metropolitanus]